MRAIQFPEPKQIRIIEVPEPPALAPGEALVEVSAVGICGTDLSGFLGKMPFFSYPRIPGHELGVRVLALGEGESKVAVGDRCSVEPYLNCQKCSSCRRGHTNCCEHNQTLGVHCDGGLQRLYVLPARKLHPSSKLSFEQLALVETLAIGCHATQRGNPQPGETILVVGAGPIGLSVVEFARLSGARTVVMDMNERRLEFCREVMGVEITVPFRGDGTEEERLREACGGDWPGVVVDATGNNRSMAAALSYAGFAGRVVYVGITTQEVSFPHPAMHRRELTLLASRNALPGDFTRIIRLIEEGRIDTAPWITHRCAFDDLPVQFESFTKPETGAIKAMVAL